MELTQAIFDRRSVREFTDHVVTDEEIRDILDAARWAPSWGNTQSWEFIVVRDPHVISDVTGTYSPGNPATQCSAAASALIVACARTGISGSKGNRDATKFSTWFMFDLGMAVQNLCLRAHELGLGTVVVGLLDHEACRKIIALPEGHEVVAVIPLGKPATGAKKEPTRKELKDIVHRDVFGTPYFTE